MKQLVQNLKSGEMKLLDVPVPALSEKKVLVRIHYSLISAGTEGSKVATARKGYIGKAKEKPEQVKQVLETLKKEGVFNTYRKVMNKLDAWAALGYSCAGEVMEVGAGVTEFNVGDRVACAGQDIANHAEVVAVPVNLCTRIPESAALEDAAYTTLGAIALQGIRQADVRLGESSVVIGLGLLGQLTVQLLKAAGISVIGIDIDPGAVETALRHSRADLAFERTREGLESSILEATDGQGVDAVIITAGTASLDPIELAGRLTRKKGKVVVVGAVPTGFSREQYYRKELELKMSCSYGPGRYDPDYEEKGIDYPYGYVRWTEKRNMQAFLSFVANGHLNIKPLTTHIFDFDKAEDAYELILARREAFLGILLKYDTRREIDRKIILQATCQPAAVKIGFVGAGSFAQTYLLPNIKRVSAASLVGVATANGNSARSVADKFGFAMASGNAADIHTLQDINTVFVATRHNLHAAHVIQALRNGKHVFVEKPLAMTEAELEEIRSVYQQRIQENPGSPPLLMVGFNRRFAPDIQKIKDVFTAQPVAINYRINAGYIPREHWTQDSKVGGGRIIGEVCHFVDLAMYLANSNPCSVGAYAMKDAQNLNDTLVVNLKFNNGSIATVSYLANGSKQMAKEYLEVFGNGVTAVLDDYRELVIWGKRRKQSKNMAQDKGHRQEVYQFLNAIQNGKAAPIAFEELYISSLLPFKIIESIQTGQMIELGESQ